MTAPLEPETASDAAAPEASLPRTPVVPLKKRFTLPLIMGGLLLGFILIVTTGWLLLKDTLRPQPVVGTLSNAAVVLELSQTGFYRITADELRQAGFEVEFLNSETIELTQQDQPVPYLVMDEAIIFYGLAPDSPYTAVRPYLLRQGTQGVVISTTTPATASTHPVTTVTQTLRLEENRYYQGQVRNFTKGDIWFWQTLQVGGKVELPFNLPLLNPDESAVLRLGLWGSTYNNQIDLDHDLEVLLNGQSIGMLRWDGQIIYTGTLTIPPGALQTGDNVLLLDNSAPGANIVDIIHLNWLELAYQTPPTAVNDRLMAAPVDGELLLNGFSDEPLLFNVANPLAPEQIGGWEMESGRIPITLSSAIRLAAIGPNGFLVPDNIRGLRVSQWHEPTNQADLLIITTDTLAPALQPLAEARAAAGIPTAIVPIAEIYDAFGEAEAGPDSLRAFLQYSHQNWADPKPRYVLLVGDVSTDFRNYLGHAPQNIIPTYLIPVTFSGETISDTRLADLDGDLQPEVAIGRWPVDDVRTAANLVERTLLYEQNPASLLSIFSADGTEAQFRSFADNLIQQNDLAETEVIKLYGQPADALTTAWNEGAWLVTYNGHGSLDMWGKEQVLTLEAVGELRPQTYASPIVLQFTCLTGLFAHPTTQSISETMLYHEQGPVLIVAATSLTLPNNQEPFAQNLLQTLRDPAYMRMGDAFLAAQRNLNGAASPGLQEIIDTFGLLGDPSARIVRPGDS